MLVLTQFLKFLVFYLMNFVFRVYRRRSWSLQQRQGGLHEAEASHALGEETRRGWHGHEETRRRHSLN